MPSAPPWVWARPSFRERSALAAQAQAQATSEAPKDPRITTEMIDAVAAIAGLTITAEQKPMMLEALSQQPDSIESIRSLHLQNATAPAFVFNPVPGGMVLDTVRKPLKLSPVPDVSHLGPSNEEALAFATSANSPNCCTPVSSPPPR